MHIPNRLTSLYVFLLLLTAAAFVQANTIYYTDQVGITMKYVDISETSMTPGDTAPLYGNPGLSGDSLFFNHMTFSSSAANGAVDQTDGKLDLTIRSKPNPNNYIDRIRFREFGDTSLTGTGTAVTRSTAACVLYLSVLQLDSGPIWEPLTVSMTMSDGGVWTMAGGPFTGKQWNGLVEVDLTGALQGLGYTGHATEVGLTLENTLTTTSELNSIAYIAKKAAGLQITALPVPEPGVLSLLLLGGFLLRKRR